MGALLILAIGVLFVYALCVLRFRISEDTDTDTDGPWPFYARKLLSKPEQVLYFRLCNALPQHIVLAQVGLSRILGVKEGNNFHQWNNRINRMTADFVVCNKDASILAVIELDDASHEKEQRRQADAKKDIALASANIRMIRWQAKAMPNEEDIRAACLAVYSGNNTNKLSQWNLQ